MRAALERQRWDLVIADYSLPEFDAPAALTLLQQAGLDLPFIVVSGAFGEEAAVAMMKAGAHDYLTKNNTARLVPAVERELREALIRRERKEAEKTLRASEERYRQLFESVNDAIFLRPISSDGSGGTFLEVNRAACEHLGYSREELLQKTPADIDPVATPEQVRMRARQALNREGVVFETMHTAKDGRLIPVEISAHLFEWGGQRIMLSIARDLTERQAAEAALRKSEEHYRSIFENAPFGIYQSTDERAVTVNSTLARMFGYESPEEMLAGAARPGEFFVLSDQRHQIIREAMASGTFVEQNVEYRRKDGSTFIAKLQMRAVRDERGAIRFLEGFVEDISQRKKMEDELALRDQRLNSFFDNATAGLCIVDADLRYVQVNEVLAQMNGQMVAQHLGQSVRAVLPDLAPFLEPLLRQILSTGEPVLNQQVSGKTASEPGASGTGSLPIFRSSGKMASPRPSAAWWWR